MRCKITTFFCNMYALSVFFVLLHLESNTTIDMKKAFLIAAASSGSGKTTLTIGLLRALRNKAIDKNCPNKYLSLCLN